MTYMHTSLVQMLRASVASTRSLQEAAASKWHRNRAVGDVELELQGAGNVHSFTDLSNQK